MGKHTFEVRDSDDAITGSWSGPGPAIPIAPPGAEFSIKEVTEAQYSLVRNNPKFNGSDQIRWTMPSDTPIEGTDSRNILRFTPTELTLVVGQSVAGGENDIQIELVDEAGARRTNVNASDKIWVSEDLKVNITLVNGVTVKKMPVGQVRHFKLTDNKQYRVWEPCDFQVITESDWD